MMAIIMQARLRTTAVAAATMLLGSLLVAASLIAALPLAAQEPPRSAPAGLRAKEKLPPALTHYKGREIAEVMSYLGADWLVRESRERERMVDRAVSPADVIRVLAKAVLRVM